MTAYLVPLVSSPQTLSIAMAGVTYNLNVYWNRPMQLWVVDIADSSGNAIVSGIPLVTGTDLFGQYEYLGIGGSLYAQTTNNTDDPPTFTNLGTTGNLYFVTSP